MAMLIEGIAFLAAIVGLGLLIDRLLGGNDED